jgi:hypothetical protein
MTPLTAAPRHSINTHGKSRDWIKRQFGVEGLAVLHEATLRGYRVLMNEDANNHEMHYTVDRRKPMDKTGSIPWRTEREVLGTVKSPVDAVNLVKFLMAMEAQDGGTE